VVQTAKPMGFAFVGIQFELEDELNKKVDLITYNSIHPLLKERILNEEIRII
jgi:predicted nucleotidyltransferase